MKTPLECFKDSLNVRLKFKIFFRTSDSTRKAGLPTIIREFSGPCEIMFLSAWYPQVCLKQSESIVMTTDHNVFAVSFNKLSLQRYLRVAATSYSYLVM